MILALLSTAFYGILLLIYFFSMSEGVDNFFFYIVVVAIILKKLYFCKVKHQRGVQLRTEIIPSKPDSGNADVGIEPTVFYFVQGCS